jgi:hypothetical protein
MDITIKMNSQTEALLNSTFIIISGNQETAYHSLDLTLNLKNDLERAGYAAMLVKGVYNHEQEHALLVPNLPIGLANVFATAYQQESYITADKGKAVLVFTDPKQNGILVASDYSELTEQSANYTELPDGTKFTFNFTITK